MKKWLWMVLLVAACTPKIPPAGEQKIVEPLPPSPAAVLVNEGLELARDGEYLDAIGRLRDAVAADANFAEAHARLGILYRRVGDLDQAHEALGKALKIQPKNSEYLYAMGTVLFDQDDYRRAEKAFRQSWAEDGRLTSLFSLAETYLRQGKESQAADAWREYLRRDADSVWGREAAKRLEELSAEDDPRGR
ncbi:tetratricopeptide repeat protein [bacterium]|nr:tetratricopeptide repeat protein [bacterium]